MSYQKIGYVVRPEGMYLPQFAEAIVKSLGEELESETALALKSIGGERTFIGSLLIDDLLRLNSPKIRPGTELHEQFLTLTIKVLNKAGFLPEDVDYVDYVDDPLLSARDAVSRMLGSKIPWYTKADFGGEKATLLTLKSLLPIALREIRAVERLRSEMYNYLRLTIGDIGYKILQGQAIDQSEKSMFLAYANTETGSPGEALGLERSGKLEIITPSQDSNPLRLEAFSLFKQSVEPGPGTRFYRLVSNMNLESLLYYYGPYAPTLPLTLGYIRPVGPYSRLRLKRLMEPRWTDQDILAGIRDRYVDLPARMEAARPTEKMDPETARTLASNALSWTMSAPIMVCGPFGKECARLFLDLPAVRLRIQDETNCAKYTWEYPSAWRQRLVMSVAGGTEQMMYTDLAIQSASHFEASVGALNMDDFKLVRLGASVEKRKIEYSGGGEIFETIHFVKRAGELRTEEVDMTEFYSRGGVRSYRPAFAEFFMPPRYWYFQQDPNAISFIAARLGLTRDEIQRNELALTISHNDASISRLTGAIPPFNIKGLIKAALNIN
jgi:hypothetical protein